MEKLKEETIIIYYLVNRGFARVEKNYFPVSILFNFLYLYYFCLFFEQIRIS